MEEFICADCQMWHPRQRELQPFALCVSLPATPVYLHRLAMRSTAWSDYALRAIASRGALGCDTPSEEELRGCAESHDALDKCFALADSLGVDLGIYCDDPYATTYVNIKKMKNDTNRNIT